MGHFREKGRVDFTGILSKLISLLSYFLPLFTDETSLSLFPLIAKSDMDLLLSGASIGIDGCMPWLLTQHINHRKTKVTEDGKGRARSVADIDL